MCLCGAGGGAPFNPLQPLRPLRALPCRQTGLVTGTLPCPLLRPSPPPPHAPPRVERSRSRRVCDRANQQVPPRVSTRRSRDMPGRTLLPARGQSAGLPAPRGAPLAAPTPQPAALRMGAEAGVSKSGKPPASPGPTAARPPASCSCQRLAKPRPPAQAASPGAPAHLKVSPDLLLRFRSSSSWLSGGISLRQEDRRVGPRPPEPQGPSAQLSRAPASHTGTRAVARHRQRGEERTAAADPGEPGPPPLGLGHCLHLWAPSPRGPQPWECTGPRPSLEGMPTWSRPCREDGGLPPLPLPNP